MSDPNGQLAPRRACRTALGAGILSLALTPAFAQEAVGDLAEDIAEGSRVLLSAELGATYTDNFYFQPETGSQQDAIGARFKPLVGYSFAVPRFRFNSRAYGEMATFDVPDSTDDYVDWGLHGGLDWLSAARHRFSYAIDLQWDHDPFGTDRTEDPILGRRELDKWTSFNNLVRYRYGLPTAPFNLELEVVAGKREYTTNRDNEVFCFAGAGAQVPCSSPAVAFGRTIFGTRFLDWERAGAQLTLLYNVSPKTALLADVLGSQTTFENNPTGAVNRDGTQLHYRVGARWQATARTSGDVRVGYVQRDSEDPSRDNFEAADWTASVGWTPLSYMQFNFQTGRRSLESYLGDTEFIDSQFYGVEWTMNWTPRLLTRLSANLSQLEFVGSDTRLDDGTCPRAAPNLPAPDDDCGDRQDDRWSYGLDIEYRVARPLYLLGGASYSARDSNFDSVTDTDRVSNERDFEVINAFIGVRYTR